MSENESEINNGIKEGSVFKDLVSEKLKLIKENPILAAEIWVKESSQALVDPLTGLYNRRFMNRELEKEIDIRERYIRDEKELAPFALVVLDLDNLKEVNDGKKTLNEEGARDSGHDIGDKYIKAMAKSMTKSIRPSDIAIRWGGDEFVIILPNTNLESAEIVVERIRERFEELKKEEKLPNYTGFSAGAVEWQNEDPEKLFKKADNKMYIEKNKKTKEKNEEK